MAEDQGPESERALFEEIRNTWRLDDNEGQTGRIEQLERIKSPELATDVAKLIDAIKTGQKLAHIELKADELDSP